MLTETTIEVVHKGKPERIRSREGIMLTPGYARARGFDMARLQAKGIIKERPVPQGKGRGFSR